MVSITIEPNKSPGTCLVTLWFPAHGRDESGFPGPICSLTVYHRMGMNVGTLPQYMCAVPGHCAILNGFKACESRKIPGIFHFLFKLFIVGWLGGATFFTSFRGSCCWIRSQNGSMFSRSSLDSTSLVLRISPRPRKNVVSLSLVGSPSGR